MIHSSARSRSPPVCAKPRCAAGSEKPISVIAATNAASAIAQPGRNNLLAAATSTPPCHRPLSIPPYSERGHCEECTERSVHSHPSPHRYRQTSPCKKPPRRRAAPARTEHPGPDDRHPLALEAHRPPPARQHQSHSDRQSAAETESHTRDLPRGAGLRTALRLPPAVNS